MYLGVFLRKRRLSLISAIIEGMIFLISSGRISTSIELGQRVRFVYNGMACLVVKGASIGDDCTIGARVTIARKFPFEKLPIIKNHVFIGFNASIMGPVEIGKNAIIAPHSLVISDVPEGTIYGGVPAKKLGEVKDLNYNIHGNTKTRKNE